MRQLIAAMAVLCPFLILGCAQFEEDGKQDNSEKTTLNQDKVNAKNLSDFVKVEVQPSTKAEKYLVYFGWPKLSSASRVRIRMDQVLSIVDSNQTTFSHEVNHNQLLTYTFDVLGPNNIIEKSFSKLVKVPRDFVVRDGQNVFKEDSKMEIQRLFLNDTPLITNGFNIEIKTESLISEKGIIETFSEGAKAGASTDGRSGGNLFIKAQTAAGQLKVFMRGESGGDGLNGQPYGGRASDGSPPGQGSIECSGRGMPYNIPQKNSESTNYTPQVCFCMENGSDGGDALNGEKGRTGGRAGHGGDAGTFKIDVVDGSAFLIQTDFKIGLAGIPGEGGDGQPGGVALGKASKCSGKVGRNGSPGPKGDSGESARDGKPASICIYIASEEKNDCF